MILGITGKPGAGKTTISNYIKSISDEFEIIEVDKVVKYILANNGIKHINDEMNKRYNMGPYDKKDITDSFFRNTIEDKMLDELFKMEIDLETLKRVRDIQQKGKNVIIDWYLLEYSTRLLEICDKTILLKAPIDLRKERVISRGNYKPNIFLLNEKSHDIRNESKYDYIIDTTKDWKQFIQNIIKKDILATPLITVIVPIYNSEKYLKDCINSIRQQTYSNLEILLINDGSSDSSLNICMEFQKIDNRIKVVNQRNQGVCSARNNGLKLAKGDYITFVDSDDIVEKNMYEILLRDIRKYNADIARCRAFIHERDGKISNFRKTEENIVYATPKEIMEAYVSGKTSIAVWDKLFKKEVLENAKFKTDVFNEDAVFVWDIIKNVSIIVYNSLQLYHHIKRTDNSLTLATFNKKHLTLDKYSEEQEKVILSYGKEYKKIAIMFRFNSLMHILKKFKRDFERSNLEISLNEDIKKIIYKAEKLIKNNQKLLNSGKIQEANDIISLLKLRLGENEKCS